MIGTRHQIRLQQWTTTKDGNKNNVEAITKTLDTWAEVRRLSGDRSSLNGRTQLTNMYEFRLRFASIDPVDITGNWRLIYDRRYFTVHSINKDKEKRFYYVIKAEAAGPR